MKYYVIINGESSLDIEGLAIESLPAISKPLMRSKREEIDGRNGDIITQLGYSAYDKTLKIGLWGDYDIDEVITFFNQEGTITFSNEPDKYYNFTILNRIDFINQLEAFRKATITIHCQPFKYKEEKTEELENEYVEQEGTSLTFNNTLVAPMNIDLKGNTLQTGTPTPSSPIPINNVSGDNKINVCGKNLFDKDTMVLSAFINQSNLQLASSNDFRTIYIPCKPNTTYTIQKIQSNRFVWGFTSDDNLTIPKTLSGVGGENTKTQKTITSTNNAKYMFVMVSKITDDTTNINDLLNSIQIEEGSTATTYEAYTGATYPINLPVQGYNTPNLYDPTTAPVIDGCMAVKSAMKLHGVSLTKIKTTYMACNQNTKYLITKTLGGTNYFDVGTTTNTPAINGSLNQCEDAITETSYEITTGANDNYIVVSYWQDSETGDTKGSITIKEYSTKKEELSKIGTYQDYFYKDNNKWYLHKEIGKVVFDGSETWSKQDNSSYSNTILRFRSNVDNVNYITEEVVKTIANYFKGGTLNIKNVESITTQFSVSGINIFIDQSRLSGTDVSDFTNWLTTHNTIVYYVLATATNTEITDTTLKEQLEAIKSANSYYGTTNINQVNNDMPFILDVSYLSGTNEITITNNGNYYSKPKLTITGTGNIGIYLNDSQIFQVALGTNETIIIDTDKMEAYYESTLKNRQVIGDYNSFKLLSGENTIKISGTFSKLQVDNYSRWI